MKKIIIMRHGEAAYSGLDRVLTPAGVQEAENTALKLASLANITRIYVSPKTRALQTAQAVISRLPGTPLTPIITGCLTPAGDAALAIEQALAESAENEQILLVSHIPLVEELTSYLYPPGSPGRFVTGSAVILAAGRLGWRLEAFICPNYEIMYD